MQGSVRKLNRFLLSGLLSAGLCLSGWAKSYSSGGHSYSSHSSSHSSGFGGGSHSFSSGSHSFSSGGSSHSSTSSGSSGSSSHSSAFTWGGSSRNDSGSKAFRSSSGKSYSSSSIWDDENRKSYSSGKSYTSGSGKLFSSGSGVASQRNNSSPSSSSSALSFDTTAARASKEAASKQEYTRFKDSQAPPVIAHNDSPGSGAGSYRASPPPLASNRGYYIPDYGTLSTRSVRIYNVFNPYVTRPVVYYHDPYSSLFWWWLLDRSLDDRAWWAYHHRYDMDPDRYQALLMQDAQLQARVSALEAQQAPRDPNYVPNGVDRDLMYSDQYIARAYNNRPTPLGVASFRILGVMAAVAFTGFFIWLIWFKRWQTV